MGWIGRLFGSDEAVSKGFDAITKTGDALVFTEEEKAGYWLDLLKAYEPFKLAQRLLALTVGIPYVSVWVISALMLVVSGFVSPEYGAQIEETSRTLAELNNDTLGTPFAIILGFYFAGGMGEGIVRAVKK